MRVSWEDLYRTGRGRRHPSLVVKEGLGCVVPHFMPLLHICMDSSLRSAPLVEGHLGHPPPPSIFLDETVSAIASSSARPDWQTLNDIDIPLRQGALSAAIDESVLKSLLASPPTTRSRALALDLHWSPSRSRLAERNPFSLTRASPPRS